MAHSTLHFAAGMVIGSAFTLPPLIRACVRRDKLSGPFARWFLWSYIVGIYAVFPAILRHLGVPDAVCDGPWMNVFLLYPWINVVKPGGITMGPLVLGALLAFQYALLLAALVWKLNVFGVRAIDRPHL